MNTESRPDTQLLSPLQHCQATWDRIKGNSPIYDWLLPRIQLVSATPGHIVAQLVLEESHVNSRGTLHGAVSATIVDWAGGMVIASTGRDKTGVSTDIHVSYIGTAKMGEVLVVEAKANKVGGTLAFTSIEIRKDSGEVVATGSHTKFVKV